MFQSIVAPIPKDPDYPARRFTIDVLTRVLEGALYDHIESPFHQEKTGAGDYVPIRQRRPCVKSNLCRVVVDDSVALLFSEGHFPTPDSDDAAVKQALLGVAKHTGLNAVMLEAATLGSVGSAAVRMRVLPDDDGAYRLVFEAHATEFLTPTFDPARPDRLVRLVERYKVKGADLDRAYGLTEAERCEDFWFQRAWDETAETWFWPLAVEDAAAGAAPRIDEGRSVAHRLGFTPWVWIRNLPGRLRLIDARPGFPAYSDVDGACTFAAAVDAMVEIDYQLASSISGAVGALQSALAAVTQYVPGLSGMAASLEGAAGVLAGLTQSAGTLTISGLISSLPGGGGAPAQSLTGLVSTLASVVSGVAGATSPSAASTSAFASGAGSGVTSSPTLAAEVEALIGKYAPLVAGQAAGPLAAAGVAAIQALAEVGVAAVNSEVASVVAANTPPPTALSGH